MKIHKRILSILLSLLIFVGLTSTVFAAFGPSRPTKEWSPSVSGFDYVTFNSFTGVPNGIGDERDFLRGVQVGRDSIWSDPVANVTQDAEIEIKAYIHNGADPDLNNLPGTPGVAKNVVVRAAIPSGVNQSHDTTFYISADNANPGTVYDTVTATGANNGYFSLEYIPGSAKLNQNGNVTTLSDNIVGSGVALEDIPGCFEYVREVTFRVKVKMPHYTLNKKVRLEGQTSNDWKENIKVKPGQTVEWKLEFFNIGKTVLNDVVILDQIPVNLTVVPGSVKLIDGNFPNGYVFGSDAVQNNGRQVNIKIGSVNPGINSIIAFKTKVDEAPELKCTTKQLINSAYATPSNPSTTITDNASITVEDSNCPTTITKLPSTGPGDVVGIFIATTIAGTLAHKFVVARRYQ